MKVVDYQWNNLMASYRKKSKNKRRRETQFCPHRCLTADIERGNMMGSTLATISEQNASQQAAKAQNTLSGKWNVLFTVLLSSLADTLLDAARALAAWKKMMMKHGLVHVL